MDNRHPRSQFQNFMKSPFNMMIGFSGLLMGAAVGFYYSRKIMHEARREHLYANRGSVADMKEKVERDVSEAPLSPDGVPRSTTTPVPPGNKTK